MNLMSEPIIFESTTQDNHDPFTEMVIDAAGLEFDWNTRNEPKRPNPTAEKFFNLKDAVDSPLWSGCEDYSELSALSELLNIKSESNLSERHFNRFLKAFGQMLPKGHKLPDSFYSSKKVVAPLGLGVEKIDACENDCMLYSKDDNKLQECNICQHPRFKPKKRGGKKKEKDIPHKQLSYLPLISRLQRLYTSKTTAEHMRWHKESLGEEGKLLHPRDGEAWKHFDRTHPTFAAETRNVGVHMFLPLDHPYRYQKDNFTKGMIEKDSSIIRLTGEELEVVVASLPNIEFGRTKEKERIEGFGETHNWLKRSIFWDLPYWRANLIRHNLDVMHIEKNMFDNVFNTVMDVKASYTLTKEERLMVMKWIKNLRLPDGYASNLARCVNLDDCSLHGMKCHDCHVFMERLLPLALRDLLPEPVWNALTELRRNDNVNQGESSSRLSVFKSIGRPFSPKNPTRTLSPPEKAASTIYILLNCPEISEYVELYDAEKQAQIPNLTYKALGVMHNKEFATWFCNYVQNPSNQITDKDIKQFSRGFSSIVKRWNGYFVNGYRFHTLEYGETKSTMNSGVWNTVILFKCKWFDSGKHGTKVHSRYKLVDVNYNRTMAEDNPFVLASQCHQVYFASYPWRKKATDRNWLAVFKETNSDPARVILDNELDDVAILTDVNRQEEEVNPVELQPSRREFEEEFESDELEVGSIDFSEEESEDEESENENNLTSDDTTRGGKSKRPFVVPSHEVDQGHVSFTSMMIAKMNHLGDLELGLNNDVDGEQELVDDVAEDVDEEEVEEERHTSEQHVEANLGIKDKIERDDKGREILVIQEKCFISVAAPRSMLGDMRGWFTKPWPTFNKILEDVKRNLFGKFRSFSAEMMRLRKKSRSATPPDYMRSDILEDLWDIWESPKFKKLQENNRKNRVSDRDGIGVALSSAGTISIAHHAQRMETYTKLKESHSQSCGDAVLSPQASSTFIPEAWAKASGGAKNGRCYGFGKSYSDSFTSFGTIPSNNSSQAEVDQLKERMQELEKEQQEIKANLSELLALTRANHANLSGQHFFPGQYSTASPGQQSASTSVGQHPPLAPIPAPYPTPAHSQYPAIGSRQFPPPPPDYYPAPPSGYFMPPASASIPTQLHVADNYLKAGQHFPVHSQSSDQLPSPGQHNSSSQRHSQE
ncbi:hypothetical protein BUALT_BualtUnG0032200 [Buddleja alternifolia]|uniref:DUF4216 domain-containing protein n=1 Tax=Buddleja alternifolia TaxID=168488 RepID=A0AAV6W6D8_9LAMI|nr:hypothetical protein BUALT_BualtUnG0032200 [Buddleja alternifolia]